MKKNQTKQPTKQTKKPTNLTNKINNFFFHQITKDASQFSIL